MFSRVVQTCAIILRSSLVKRFCCVLGPLVNIFYLVRKLFLIIDRPKTSVIRQQPMTEK